MRSDCKKLIPYSIFRTKDDQHSRQCIIGFGSHHSMRKCAVVENSSSCFLIIDPIPEMNDRMSYAVLIHKVVSYYCVWHVVRKCQHIQRFTLR